MAGPIDFASDGPTDPKGPTEFGGRAGLVQRFADGHVELTTSEKRGVMVRAVAATKVDPETGFDVADESGPAIDPVTGRVVEDEWNEDGSKPTTVTDVPPKTENP